MGSISTHASAAQHHGASESNKIYQPYLLDCLHQQLPDSVQLANQALLTVAAAPSGQFLHRLPRLSRAFHGHKLVIKMTARSQIASPSLCFSFRACPWPYLEKFALLNFDFSLQLPYCSLQTKGHKSTSARDFACKRSFLAR